MTTASVLLTVTTSWGSSTEKCEEKIGRHAFEGVAKVAAQELRETPAVREQALAIMRGWISQNPDIRNIRQDDVFLLRFLRQKKFSIPMAQQTLLKYLNLRKYYPECFSKLDCQDSVMEEILKDGYVVVSPSRDCKGRRVIIYNIAKFDATKYTCWDLSRAHTIIYETLLEDPADQVCGVVHVGDGSGTTTAHITAWNPVDLARLMKWGEQSMPMRHKECHLINIHPTIKYVIDFATSKVTPKMAQRLKVHTNIKQLHKHVDTSCLPTNFGGPIPLQDMISFTRSLLREQRDKLLSLDSMELLNPRGIISSRARITDKTGEVASIQGSFRKLEID